MIKVTFLFCEKKNNSLEIIFIISLSANTQMSFRIEIDLKKKKTFRKSSLDHNGIDFPSLVEKSMPL